jgi:hypothetical protein
MSSFLMDLALRPQSNIRLQCKFFFFFFFEREEMSVKEADEDASSFHKFLRRDISLYILLEVWAIVNIAT